jgi:hypothetical protein
MKEVIFMSFNPNDTIPLPPSSLVEKKQPITKTPAIVLSSAKVRVMRAQRAAEYVNKKLVPVPETHADTLQRIKMGPTEIYIEWWQLGTPATDINCATLSTINIKHFCKTFSKHKHLSMVFIRRECDQKVLYDRRTN